MAGTGTKTRSLDGTRTGSLYDGLAPEREWLYDNATTGGGEPILPPDPNDPTKKIVAKGAKWTDEERVPKQGRDPHNGQFIDNESIGLETKYPKRGKNRIPYVLRNLVGSFFGLTGARYVKQGRRLVDTWAGRWDEQKGDFSDALAGKDLERVIGEGAIIERGDFQAVTLEKMTMQQFLDRFTNHTLESHMARRDSGMGKVVGNGEYGSEEFTKGTRNRKTEYNPLTGEAEDNFAMGQNDGGKFLDQYNGENKLDQYLNDDRNLVVDGNMSGMVDSLSYNGETGKKAVMSALKEVVKNRDMSKETDFGDMLDEAIGMMKIDFGEGSGEIDPSSVPMYDEDPDGMTVADYIKGGLSMSDISRYHTDTHKFGTAHFGLGNTKSDSSKDRRYHEDRVSREELEELRKRRGQFDEDVNYRTGDQPRQKLQDNGIKDYNRKWNAKQRPFSTKKSHREANYRKKIRHYFRGKK